MPQALVDSVLAKFLLFTNSQAAAAAASIGQLSPSATEAETAAFAAAQNVATAAWQIPAESLTWVKAFAAFFDRELLMNPITQLTQTSAGVTSTQKTGEQALFGGPSGALPSIGVRDVFRHVGQQQPGQPGQPHAPAMDVFANR